MRWFFCFLLLVTPAFAEAVWRHYESARYGFSIDVPAGFGEARESDNGDGATFTSADSAARLLVWGSRLMDQTLKEDSALRIGEEQKDGWSISYSPLKRSWYAYSGTKDGRIVYTKAVSACGGEVALYFRIEYPKSEKTQYDAMVTRLSKSLKAGPGSECQ